MGSPRKKPAMMMSVSTFSEKSMGRMDAISLRALDRLFAIDSKEAVESLEYYKRCFPPDGGYGVFFGEREERRRASEAQGGSEK